MNISPDMFEQAKKNLNPEMMKQATNMFSNMTDDQIRQYASMSGLGNIDPSILRNSANMMKGMKDEELENFQKIASNSSYADMVNKTRQFQQSQPQQSQQQLYQDHELTPKFKQIADFKQKGNDAFKASDYTLASELYLQAIMEIEEVWVQNKSLQTNQQRELQQLEVSCRSNFCNVKAKQGDFDSVILHALQVLKIEQNGKACFRLGQAFKEKKQLERSFEYLKKAKNLLPQDQQVQILYNEVKEKIEPLVEAKSQQEIEREKKIQELKKQLEELESQKQKDANLNSSFQEEEKFLSNNKQSQQQTQQEQQQQQQQQSKKKPKVKLESVDTESTEFQTLKKSVSELKQKKDDDEVIITEEKEEQKQPIHRSQSTPFPNSMPTLNDPNVQQSMNQFKNMNPDQMKQMVNMMKGMDKNFFKSMMKSQSGMDLSDQQIEMMQNMISPELLQSMQNMDPSMVNNMRQMKQDQQSISQTQQNTNNSTSTNEVPSQPPTQESAPPSLSSIMQNPQMIKIVLEQLKANPEMLRSMTMMLGSNHPVSSFIEKSSPEQLKRLVVWMSRLIQFVFAMYKVYQVMRQYWYILLGIILAYLFFRWNQ